MKALYKYPHSAFPYQQLVTENKSRDRRSPEFELIDTGVFNENQYFDVSVEYAKNSATDILMQITVTNHGAETHDLHVLPTMWFRNTWAWQADSIKPSLKIYDMNAEFDTIESEHETLGKQWLYCQKNQGLLFTENETNNEKVFGIASNGTYFKDGINDYVVDGNLAAIEQNKNGTKAAAHYILSIEPHQTQTIQIRLCDRSDLTAPFADFDNIVATRQREADEFYHRIAPVNLTADLRNIQRQAYAGMLWSKQYYHYIVEDWLKGDLNSMPPKNRQSGRNHEWLHLYTDDILSMPDKWEYPWFAAWDLAFHCVPLATIDPEFAKRQLDVLTREWYMHPNGQIPAYEWAFGDVNPPVHAWATWRIYQIEQQVYGRSDMQFLERVFQKLLLNFTWWVNRKDMDGKNIFQGGFLGLDNIGVFDRSAELPTGGYIDQSDGTSWMAMYSLNMLTIALELAKSNPVYEDIASKFFEHYLYIADAINHIGDMGASLWDEQDGFYYDVLRLPDEREIKLKVRSMVGLISLFAIDTLEPETLTMLPTFKKRMDWFIKNRPDLRKNVACMEKKGVGAHRLLAIVWEEKLKRILHKMLDETEFLSDYGIRALSKVHAEDPYIFHLDGMQFRVDYEPAESTSGLFGGNSNWRGPIWFPVNFLLIESLQKFDRYFGDSFQIECPTGSGQMMNLKQVAAHLSERIMQIFMKDKSGRRPVYGATDLFQTDPNWQDNILFYEYFHGDNGAGIGASHQTGWTGLVAELIQQLGNDDRG